MDETAFRQARGELNPQPCPFEKAILARCCACPLSERRCIAEREAVACREAASRRDCVRLRELLRGSSAFALGHAHIDGPLPHAQEMKVQCGGLRGLQQAVAPAAEVADVAGLLRAAREKYGNLENLPYSAIVQEVAACRLRRRRDS